MRTLRKFLQMALPILGGVLLLYSAVAVPSIQRQFVILGVGFIVLLLGAWRLFHWLLPSERRFLALRAEVDEFITLVRQLNTSSVEAQANPEASHVQAIQDLQRQMHVSIDRMVDVAGVSTEASKSVPPPEKSEGQEALVS